MNQLTKKQRTVYEFLRKSNCSLSAYDVLHSLDDPSFRAPSQVYRVLSQLLELGLIHRVESLNAFVACEQRHNLGQSVISICDDCGLVQEMPARKLMERIEEFSSMQGFQTRQLAVELKGQCSQCC